MSATEIHPAACANCGRPADLEVWVGTWLSFSGRFERWSWLCDRCAVEVEVERESEAGARA